MAADSRIKVNIAKDSAENILEILSSIPGMNIIILNGVFDPNIPITHNTLVHHAYALLVQDNFDMSFDEYIEQVKALNINLSDIIPNNLIIQAIIEAINISPINNAYNFIYKETDKERKKFAQCLQAYIDGDSDIQNDFLLQLERFFNRTEIKEALGNAYKATMLNNEQLKALSKATDDEDIQPLKDPEPLINKSDSTFGDFSQGFASQNLPKDVKQELSKVEEQIDEEIQENIQKIGDVNLTDIYNWGIYELQEYNENIELNDVIQEYISDLNLLLVDDIDQSFSALDSQIISHIFSNYINSNGVFKSYNEFFALLDNKLHNFTNEQLAAIRRNYLIVTESPDLIIEKILSSYFGEDFPFDKEYAQCNIRTELAERVDEVFAEMGDTIVQDCISSIFDNSNEVNNNFIDDVTRSCLSTIQNNAQDFVSFADYKQQHLTNQDGNKSTKLNADTNADTNTNTGTDTNTDTNADTDINVETEMNTGTNKKTNIPLKNDQQSVSEVTPPLDTSEPEQEPVKSKKQINLSNPDTWDIDTVITQLTPEVIQKQIDTAIKDNQYYLPGKSVMNIDFPGLFITQIQQFICDHIKNNNLLLSTIKDKNNLISIIEKQINMLTQQQIIFIRNVLFTNNYDGIDPKIESIVNKIGNAIKAKINSNVWELSSDTDLYTEIYAYLNNRADVISKINDKFFELFNQNYKKKLINTENINNIYIKYFPNILFDDLSKKDISNLKNILSTNVINQKIQQAFTHTETLFLPDNSEKAKENFSYLVTKYIVTKLASKLKSEPMDGNRFLKIKAEFQKIRNDEDQLNTIRNQLYVFDPNNYTLTNTIDPLVKWIIMQLFPTIEPEKITVQLGLVKTIHKYIFGKDKKVNVHWSNLAANIDNFTQSVFGNSANNTAVFTKAINSVLKVGKPKVQNNDSSNDSANDTSNVTPAQSNQSQQNQSQQNQSQQNQSPLNVDSDSTSQFTVTPVSSNSPIAQPNPPVQESPIPDNLIDSNVSLPSEEKADISSPIVNINRPPKVNPNPQSDENESFDSKAWTFEDIANYIGEDLNTICSDINSFLPQELLSVFIHAVTGHIIDWIKQHEIISGTKINTQRDLLENISFVIKKYYPYSKLIKMRNKILANKNINVANIGDPFIDNICEKYSELKPVIIRGNKLYNDIRTNITNNDILTPALNKIIINYIAATNTEQYQEAFPDIVQAVQENPPVAQDKDKKENADKDKTSNDTDTDNDGDDVDVTKLDDDEEKASDNRTFNINNISPDIDGKNKGSGKDDNKSTSNINNGDIDVIDLSDRGRKHKSPPPPNNPPITGNPAQSEKYIIDDYTLDNLVKSIHTYNPSFDLTTEIIKAAIGHIESNNGESYLRIFKPLFEGEFKNKPDDNFAKKLLQRVELNSLIVNDRTRFQAVLKIFLYNISDTKHKYFLTDMYNQTYTFTKQFRNYMLNNKALIAKLNNRLYQAFKKYFDAYINGKLDSQKYYNSFINLNQANNLDDSRGDVHQFKMSNDNQQKIIVVNGEVHITDMSKSYVEYLHELNIIDPIESYAAGIITTDGCVFLQPIKNGTEEQIVTALKSYPERNISKIYLTINNSGNIVTERRLAKRRLMKQIYREANLFW